MISPTNFLPSISFKKSISLELIDIDSFHRVLNSSAKILPSPKLIFATKFFKCSNLSIWSILIFIDAFKFGLFNNSESSISMSKDSLRNIFL